MTTWAELAQMKSGEQKAPPLLPQGHYMGLITGQPELGASSKKQTPFATFPVRLTEALADVDQEELGAIEGNPLEKEREITFYITPNSAFLLVDLARGLGADVDNQTITDTVEWLGGCGEPIVFRVEHEPNTRNPDRPFVRLSEAVAATVWEEQQQAA